MTDPTPIPRLCFDPDTRRIGLRTGKVELGQHVHDAYRALVATALGVAPEHIDVLHVTTADSPDDGLTVGSLSIQVTGAQITTAARDTRRALHTAAARHLGAEAGALTLDADTLSFHADSGTCDLFDLVDPAEHTRIDPQSAPTVASAILGQTHYIQDLTFSDMRHARALRGRPLADVTPLLSPDDTLIEDGGFAAIVTPDPARIDALWADLPTVPAPGITSCDGPTADWLSTQRALTTGDAPPDTTLPHAVTATRPFLLHGSIAPSCGLALWTGDTLTVWSHSQGIFPLRAQITRALDLAPDAVTVHHVRSAGCYGHNGADDAAMDAALIARHTPGHPIRVAWPRTDDTQLAPLGAPMQVTAAAALDDQNRVSDWHMTIHSAPHGQRPGGGGQVNLLAAMERDPALRPTDIADLPAAVGFGAARNATPIYDIARATAQTHIAQDLPVRTSSLRGLGAQMNTVAIEALMDHLAQTCGQSPFEFRRAHLTDPRAIAVLDRLATTCPNTTAPDEGIGIALGRYKNKAAYAAVAVHMQLTDEPQLLAIQAVVDAGRVVSRDGALNQIEGGIIQAASWTLCEAAYLRDGQLDATGWEDYPTLDWSRVPPLNVDLMDKPSEAPLGVGECMVGPTSAAIVNALTACLGQSVTTLPLTRETLISALS